jgi:phenolic acid decarboxylase
MNLLKRFLLAVSLGVLSQGAFSQEAQHHALADLEISYTYTDGGVVTLTLSDGKLGYLWTAGPFAGTEVRGLDYYSRELAESLYFVSWHDPENKNFVTLIFDFDQMIEHGTALIGYETDMETTLFDEATIHSVREL